MSAPGHCRHCHHLCPGGDEEYVGNGAYVREHCSVDDEAQWSDGHCPACDEASRIADWLEQREKENGYIDTDGYLSYRVVTGDAYAKEIREMNRGGRR